ncbi:MAG: MFS transporter [Dehalococcoidia bacterium]|nr:MFS transporter [Chloroflexi bacterium CFX7]MCK6565734.1 MFS transporter [Dehalococcoidia bacterium]MCL4231843.1 MFS transporter [Dehalococcoidia bacterium]NUQ54255.1 MFS transporter [Dehalococcoidia bacterium]RIL03363.1 MAG: hypothetical protein DCC78_04860 [bacterium]
MARWFTTTFAALRIRNFRLLWIGSLLAFAAFFMSTVVQSVVAFDLTGNNSSVGVVVFAQGVAQTILGPLGGAMADRASRRKVILACQLLITAAFIFLAVLIGLDRVTILLLAVGSFAIGSAFSFLGPSRQAFAIDLVGGQQRGNAMALNQVAFNAGRIIGPLLGGAFLAIAILGATGAYVGMAAFYVLAVTTTLLLPEIPAAGVQRRSILGDIAGGIQYVAHDPALRVLVLSFFIVMMVGFPYVTVLPGMLENELGRDSKDVSILYGATAVGGLIASLSVAAMADSPRANTVYRAAGFGFGVSLLLAAVSPGFAVLALVMFGLGATSGAFQTLNGAIIAHLAEPAFLGRVMSLTFMAFAGFQLIALPIGVFADAAGERATLAVMGGVVCLAIVVFALMPAHSAGRPHATVAVEAES